jgi:hypothetical protein
MYANVASGALIVIGALFAVLGLLGTNLAVAGFGLLAILGGGLLSLAGARFRSKSTLHG